MMTRNNYAWAIGWCHAHRFPWKIINGSIFWKTAIQTGEIDRDKKTLWHDRDFFDTLEEDG